MSARVSTFAVLFAAGCAGLFVSGDASAQNAPTTQGENSCLRLPAKLSDQAIKDFLVNPEALLAKHPVGGLPMTTEVRGLVASDISTLAVVVGLGPKANAPQKASIGAGTAQAAQACLRDRPDLAQRIQAFLGQAGDRDILTAFLTAGNTFEAAALGIAGGTGGAVGGAIGGTGGGGGGSSFGGSSGGSNIASAGGGSYSTGGGGTSYSTTRSVSRTR